MSEENTITLELTPTAPVIDEAVDAAFTPVDEIKNEAEAAAAEISRTPEERAAALAQATEESKSYLADANLSDSEMQMVNDFSQKIDLKDSSVILQYGAAAQKKIAAFSDNALEGVKTKDLGEVGKMITDLVVELKGFSIEDNSKSGLFGFLKKKGNDLTKLKSRYDTAENNVDKISGALESHQNQLQKDIIMMDKMYASNLNYFKELTMYILAGKKRLEEEQNTTLAELKKKAEESGLAEDAQAANDFASLCDRFDKKLHDLELTRTVSMQMAPQIRMIQNSDSLMVEKIQSTINNTIPLWKNQMVLALGLAHSKEAMEAQKEVNDLTNSLIKKNAETLKQGSIEIAEESEKGIISLETVQYSNQQLIESLDEVVRIQEEGRIRRREAETELGRIETELKQKLLDIRNSGTVNVSAASPEEVYVESEVVE